MNFLLIKVHWCVSCGRQQPIRIIVILTIICSFSSIRILDFELNNDCGANGSRHRPNSWLTTWIVVATGGRYHALHHRALIRRTSQAAEASDHLCINRETKNTQLVPCYPCTFLFFVLSIAVFFRPNGNLSCRVFITF